MPTDQQGGYYENENPDNKEQSKIKSAEEILDMKGIGGGHWEYRIPVLEAMYEFNSQFKPLSVPIQQDKKEIEIILQLFNVFMPAMVSLEDKKQIAMYNAYHRIKNLSLSVPVLPENKSKIASCLEDAVNGMEWRVENEPATLDKSDYEKLDEWKAALRDFGQVVLPISDEENKIKEGDWVINTHTTYPYQASYQLEEELRTNGNDGRIIKITKEHAETLLSNQNPVLISNEGIEKEADDERFKSVVFFIEANSYEQLMLWNENHDKTNWEQDCMGYFQQIGFIDNDDKKPVCVSFSFAKIFGKMVCFYDCTSRYCDHTMIENWIKKNYPIKWDNGIRVAMTDAMNFHHAIDRCKNEN